MSGTVRVGRSGVAQQQGLGLTEVLSVRLTAADVEQLNAAAAWHGVDASTFARRLIYVGLALDEIKR